MLIGIYEFIRKAMTQFRRVFDVSAAGFAFIATLPLFLMVFKAAPNALLYVLSGDGAVYLIYTLVYLLLCVNNLSTKHKLLVRVGAVTLSVILSTIYGLLAYKLTSELTLKVSELDYSLISLSFWIGTWALANAFRLKF